TPTPFWSSPLPRRAGPRASVPTVRRRRSTERRCLTSIVSTPRLGPACSKTTRANASSPPTSPRRSRRSNGRWRIARPSATWPEKVPAYARWRTSGGVRARGVGDGARDLAAQSVKLLESAPPGAERAQAYATLAQLMMVGGHDHRSAIALGRRAVELGGELGDEQTVVHALNTIGTAEVCMGD